MGFGRRPRCDDGGRALLGTASLLVAGREIHADRTDDARHQILDGAGQRSRGRGRSSCDQHGGHRARSRHRADRAPATALRVERDHPDDAGSDGHHGLEMPGRHLGLGGHEEGAPQISGDLRQLGGKISRPRAHVNTQTFLHYRSNRRPGEW
jgi:hypothetical protein